uniref:Uncharacterized protein n=1 Tax=Neobodo designis TaxID=312471 RepID=A0A7S1LYX0_NEODS|mmetsp:Transcript_30911/g.95461  ORF Transcript_30911/g.95461 Transcript_30911/m.95461 type:complete len:126 (+) Transcript_30911:110-487(+)
MLRRSCRALVRPHTSNFFRHPEAAVPFAEAVKEVDASGADAAWTTFADWRELQGALLAYRTMRLIDEARELRRNPSNLIPDMGTLPFFGQLVFCFVFGWWFTRGATAKTFTLPPDEILPCKPLEA